MFLSHLWFIILKNCSLFGIFSADQLLYLTTSFDEPFMTVDDFNINMLFSHFPPSPRPLNLIIWLDCQDLCCLNLDIPAQSGPGDQSSLLDLTFLPPSLYKRFTFYVHPYPYDSDRHTIILLTDFLYTSSHPSFLPRWKFAAQSFNNTDLQRISSYQSFPQACINAIKTTKITPIWRTQPLRPWWDEKCSLLLHLKRRDRWLIPDALARSG